jgi:uroporphyrinogen decarboxylase
MNGRERLMLALQRGEPDRVPVFEIAVDPRVINGIVPDGDLPAFVEALDLDAISTGPYYARQPLDENTYRDEWGTIYGVAPEMSGGPLDGPIHAMSDLRHYRPPDPLAEGRLGTLPEYVQKFKGQRAIVWHQREAFMTTALLSGLQRFLEMMYDDPELVRKMVDTVVEVHVALARRAVRAGADIVSLGDDYAWRTGPLMSPAQFRQFFLPGITRVVQAVHEDGALCFKHCDGNIWALMDAFVEAGFDGINPLEPIAGMDLGEAKRRYGGQVCLLGNVDCGYVLSQAPLLEVEAVVKKCLRDGGPGGGYVLMSSNSLHSSVRPENYRSMVETARKYGRYPLDMTSLE